MSLHIEENRESKTGTRVDTRQKATNGAGHNGVGKYSEEATDLLFVVIDSRALIRDCLLRCLKAAVGERSVVAFASLADWIEASPAHPKPNLLLVCAGRRSKLDEQTERGLAELGEAGKLPPTVLLSDSEDADEILEALDKGAKGYIPTSVTLDVAVEAMQLVRAGGVFVPASSLLSARRSMEAATTARKSNASGLFTERQEAVVEALRHGKPNKIIAYELSMRESTVKVHVRNIMKKLNAKNRTEVAYLTRNMFNDNG